MLGGLESKGSSGVCDKQSLSLTNRVGSAALERRWRERHFLWEAGGGHAKVGQAANPPAGRAEHPPPDWGGKW